MRVINIMYDSLNRHLLSPYGCDFTITKNFRRLQEKSVTFDNFYAGSLPCMPARREMHTGRYNFLHRSWGPLEPFDQSVYKILSENGIYTHFVSDHAHYWQEGGLTYHTKFSTCEFIRGQEGDLWRGDVCGYTEPLDMRRQDEVNRRYIQKEEEFPHVKVFRAGMDFLEKNVNQDNWCLHLEYFDPHEPFYAPESYKKMYDSDEFSCDWPPYGKIGDKQELKSVRRNYYALLTFCDVYLGKILDFMDEHDMWKDTMLIVNTDHGYLLGEHGYYAKNYMPVFEEISHLPFFIWDPVSGQRNIRNSALSQTIDIAPTLCDFFHLDIPKEMQGKSLLPVLRDGATNREYALFGYFGKHVNITDGRYVYMRAGRREKLYNYTIMPTHIFTPFSKEELQKTERVLCDSFSFTDGIPVMKVPAETSTSPDNSAYWFNRHMEFGDLLYDLKIDSKQKRALKGEKEVEQRMIKAMISLMKESEAPKEQFERLGLQREETEEKNE